MNTIRVHASAPYDVLVGRRLLEKFGMFVWEVSEAQRVMLVTDDRVDLLYGDTAIVQLESAGFEAHRFVFPGGEASKSFSTLKALLEAAVESRLTRKDLMLALGGGVAGDLTGFAASVYMRGIPFVQVPTTLLAAVDASVGGKTAVDLDHGKNLAGTFWQPLRVICDTEILRALPQDIFSNGMAEVIKHGVIGDEAILHCIGDGQVLERLDWLIQRNIEIKRGIVEADEREDGQRMILNFGHTVAHAIEKISNYEIPHGIAVGTGMVYEARVAEKLGACRKGLADKIERYCQEYGLYVQQDISSDFIEAMKVDKKNEDDLIVFALPERTGVLKIQNTNLDEIASILLESNKQR